MKPIQLLLLPFIFIFITGCPPKEVNINPNEIKLKDYTFETTPNDLNSVGFVFVVDRNKMLIPVTMLDLKPKEYTVVVPQSSSSKEMSISALAKFLGVPQLNLNANTGLDNTTKVKTSFSLDNPKLSVTFLTDLDGAIAAKKAEMSRALTNQNLQNENVYVVFQTIKAKKVTYDFSNSKVGKAALDAVFKNIAETKNGMTWNNNGAGSLSYDLKNDLNVFYKIFKIDVHPGANALEFQRQSKPVENEELIYETVKQ